MTNALRTAVSALITGAAVLMFGTPADAVVCTPFPHTTTAGILTTTNGEVIGTPSGATLRMRSGAVEVGLPTAAGKALWLQPVVAGVKLADVRDLAIRTRQLVPGSVSMPSFQLQINPGITGTDSAPFTFSTLVYEPYQSGHAIPADAAKTWDSLDGSEKWWSTRAARDAGFAAQSAPESWSAILARYPNATVLAYGWGVGSGAPGTLARLSSVQFGTTSLGCSIHTWSAPVATASPTPSVSVSPSVSPSASATGSVSPSATGSASPSSSATVSASETTSAPVGIPADPGGDLPVTGSSLGWLILAGAAALAAGIVARVAWRKRRTGAHQ